MPAIPAHNSALKLPVIAPSSPLAHLPPKSALPRYWLSTEPSRDCSSLDHGHFFTDAQKDARADRAGRHRSAAPGGSRYGAAMRQPQSALVQHQHAPAVLANRLARAERWGRPCLAYNVCVWPDSTGAAAFAAVQARVLDIEPSLLQIPAEALHSCLAWLLPGHEEFDCHKEELWRRHGPQWTAALADAAGRSDPFELRF